MTLVLPDPQCDDSCPDCHGAGFLEPIPCVCDPRWSDSTNNPYDCRFCGSTMELANPCPSCNAGHTDAVSQPPCDYCRS